MAGKAIHSHKVNPDTAREPQLPPQPGQGCCAMPQELGRALGSLLECKPDVKFAHLEYHALQETSSETESGDEGSV